MFTFGRLLNIPFYVTLLLHRDPQKSNRRNKQQEAHVGLFLQLLMVAQLLTRQSITAEIVWSVLARKKETSRLTQLPAVWRERSLTFCISPRQRQIVEQRPQAKTLLSLAQTYGNHEHSHRRDRVRKCSMAHFRSKNILTHSERLVPCKFIRFLRSWSVAHGDTISWDRLNPTNENSQPKTTSSVYVASWLYNMFIWCINAGQDAEFCRNQSRNQPSSLTPSWSMWPTSCYCLKWQIRGAIRLIMFGEEKGVKFVSFCFSSTLGPSQVLR